MAIYHLSVKAVSRSAGRSATAAAAYRAGCEIADERTGEIHDYRRKAGVESADIVLPDGAPEWATDRAKLWNAAELAEKRKDACVAREFEVALPAELSTAERRRLAFDFAKDMANREGCAVDVAIHAPGREGDNRNHHAHILRTTRKVEADGLGAKLDTEKAGRKRSDDLEAVRAKWADLMNERLRENGIAARVDHRSLEAQGIDRVPTKHLGPVATAYERRTGEPSRKRLDYRDEALERLAHAREAGELERQAKEADRSIIDLSGDLEEAKRERTAQQQRDQEQGQQAEHRRIERMTSTELSHEIGRVRPPKALDLVERDRSVMQAEQERQTLEKRHAEAGSALARARGQAQAWREAHGIRAALHDKGLMQSSTLAELEQQGEAARIELLKLAPRIEDAALTVRSAREAAHLRINAEQAPALAKVDELERLRREKLRQEFEQQKRQQAEKKAEREREAVPKDFKLMAQKREMKASGWGDRGDQWQAAPDGLKKLIEGYNAAPKEARPAILDRILSDSSRREQVHGLIAEQRAQHRENDRGLSR